MIKKFAPLFFSAAVLSFLFITFWHTSPGPGLTDLNVEMEVDMNIRDFTMTKGRDGRQTWKVISDNAGFVREDDLFVLYNPVITYYTEEDSAPVVITASHGQALQTENMVHLWPDVRADYGGLIIESGRASYMGEEDFILLREGVTFVGNGMALNSPEARFYLNEDRLEALGGVKTLLQNRTVN
ncbi:LPS export ABC transporter periplasmic protein LptC [Desulfonatronovibrio magnus]|uniref:LPS export ABC transporter periplasmic protein LptC n=1 Tax=Desulfonatronovibrio magnus TaxID=698827 RepID=UPI0005EB063E|nr:LPS export ABC transporter periplasmic protein LptC [Desulfonatronovibrio magnus]